MWWSKMCKNKTSYIEGILYSKNAKAYGAPLIAMEKLKEEKLWNAVASLIQSYTITSFFPLFSAYLFKILNALIENWVRRTWIFWKRVHLENATTIYWVEWWLWSWNRGEVNILWLNIEILLGGFLLHLLWAFFHMEDSWSDKLTFEQNDRDNPLHHNHLKHSNFDVRVDELYP